MPLLARVAASFFGRLKKKMYLCTRFFTNMKKKQFFTLLLTADFACSAGKAYAQDEEIIEHQGNKYIIHIEKLAPDSEMSLLDVLHMCPELISSDGKTITAEYELSVDDMMLTVDCEPLMENIKACDLSQVVVCTYGAVNNAMDGVTGSIDLQFKEGKGLSGKVALSGSTYGNGRIYADITHQGENVTIQGFAQTNLLYGSGTSTFNESVTSRSSIENAMVFLNWNLSEQDQLRFKFIQGYQDLNNKIRGDETSLDIPNWIRYGELNMVYERTLNEQEATLYIETGLYHMGDDLAERRARYNAPWWIGEVSFPLFNKSLSVTAGWEGGYLNLWTKERNREQYLNNDLYVQLDYTRGPWVICIGDRYRFNNFWDRRYDTSDHSQWSYNRNNNAFFASVGYKWGHHFVQGVFNRTFFQPDITLLYIVNEEDEAPNIYNTLIKTNLAWRSEARYTYQTDNLVATGSLAHTLITDLMTPNESLIGLRTSVTWKKGPLRLTAGANYYHEHINSDETMPSRNTNYFTLKLAPTLLLGNGFRLSSVLIYNSERELYYKQSAHFYASVKVNKDLGKRCNVFADFHDIAGQPTTDQYVELLHSYKNRALTIGLTYYPFRK